MEPCLFCSDMLLRAEINTAIYLHGDTDQSSSSCKCHHLTVWSLTRARPARGQGRAGTRQQCAFLAASWIFPCWVSPSCGQNTRYALLTTYYFSPVRHQQRAVLAAVVAEVAHGAGDAGGVAVGGGEGRGGVLGVAAARCYLSSQLRSYHGSTWGWGRGCSRRAWRGGWRPRCRGRSRGRCSRPCRWGCSRHPAPGVMRALVLRTEYIFMTNQKWEKWRFYDRMSI